MNIPKHAKTEPWIRNHVNHDSDECLIWPFGRDSYGYGRAKVAGFNTRLAHRIICELANGPAHNSSPICRHTCGNGHLGCVNPKHLAWGTQVENSADSAEHGTKAFGEKIGRSVLSEERVKAIRSLTRCGWSQRRLAAAFGVSHGTVQAVIEGRTWGHVR